MLKKYLLAATLAGFALANPLPADDNSIARRDDKVGTEDFCSHEPATWRSMWYVYATKESMPISEECGAGYLDNLRGECGVITNWGCMFHDEDGVKVEEKEKNEDRIKGARMTFETAGTCSGNNIMEAMKVASAVGKGPDECIDAPEWIL